MCAGGCDRQLHDGGNKGVVPCSTGHHHSFHQAHRSWTSRGCLQQCWAQHWRVLSTPSCPTIKTSEGMYDAMVHLVVSLRLNVFCSVTVSIKSSEMMPLWVQYNMRSFFTGKPEVSKILFDKPGVGQNMALHGSPTARNCVFLISAFVVLSHFFPA